MPVPAQVLVAPDRFGPGLRAPAVAAAIGRGLERAGLAPPDLCPLSGGGEGTIEVLLPALGGEARDGFALVEGGATAIVEHVPGAADATGSLVAAAAATGAAVVVVAAGAAGTFDGGAGAAGALAEGGGPRGASVVVLCETRAAWPAAADGAKLARDPRGVAMSAAGGGLAGALWSQCGARLVAGAPFVLAALGFDVRMRAARAVIVGEARLDRGTLAGRVAGEAAIRARQAGVPCHAIAGVRALDRFDARILDLQAIREAPSLEAIEATGEALATYL